MLKKKNNMFSQWFISAQKTLYNHHQIIIFQVSGGSWCALQRQQALPLPQKPGQLPACFTQPYLEWLGMCAGGSEPKVTEVKGNLGLMDLFRVQQNLRRSKKI